MQLITRLTRSYNDALSGHRFNAFPKKLNLFLIFVGLLVWIRFFTLSFDPFRSSLIQWFDPINYDLIFGRFLPGSAWFTLFICLWGIIFFIGPIVLILLWLHSQTQWRDKTPGKTLYFLLIIRQSLVLSPLILWMQISNLILFSSPYFETMVWGFFTLFLFGTSSKTIVRMINTYQIPRFKSWLVVCLSYGFFCIVFYGSLKFIYNIIGIPGNVIA
jgi:hypothetical protein